MTDALVQFLRARLDEDEQTARNATPGGWSTRNLGRHDLSAVIQGAAMLAQTDSPHGAADGLHIARHDPARVLAEVDAKRRLLELCSPPLVEVTGPGDGARQFVPGEGKPWGDDVMRLLALPYASHRDYREDWRP
ncbi:DUF6221 family protein [Streptomyces yangpuensis]|uniref:DUF6221 family protein n=1 Tax=Streptomyces yangpuensis TaxID=1648182 RepID=UPI0036640544